jgi:RNA polymerase sigma factor (sigma-70 family)
VAGTILERVAAGDPAAFEECIRQYSGLIWSLTRRFSANFMDGEDAVQEIFIAIWKNAARFDAMIASESTFITMIARRRLIDRRRKNKRSLNASSIDEKTHVPAPEQTDKMEIQEETHRVRELMGQLRPADRRILKLSLDEGWTHKEIAEATSIPLGTVKTHVRRGLHRLRELLQSDTAMSGIKENAYDREK